MQLKYVPFILQDVTNSSDENRNKQTEKQNKTKQHNVARNL